MKRFFKGLLAVTASAVMLSFGAFAAQEKKLSVLVVGNSITEHAPSESLGWTGNWGMAATDASKDYYSLLQKKVAEKYPDYDVTFSKSGAYTFEKSVTTSTTYDYTAVIEACFGTKMKEVNPDIITFQWGDNAKNCNEESFAYALSQVVDYCRAYNPNVTIILSQHFYGSGGDDKCLAVADVAKEKGVTFVKLYQANKTENLAYEAFGETAFSSHPGDKGMEQIADMFFTEIDKVLATKEGNNPITVMVDGKFIEFDVPPTVIDGRTLVPTRAIFEAIGADVNWDQATKTVSSEWQGTSVTLTLNSDVMIKNGEEIKLDVPATIIDGRTLVPARAIAEAFDCKVNWLKDTREVQVWSPDIVLDVIGTVEGTLFPFSDAESKRLPKGITATGVDDVQFVENPTEAGDTVYLLETNVAPGSKSWTYIWAETTGEMKAGQSYLVSFDVMHKCNAAGEKPEKSSTGICFKYADSANGGTVQDHGVGTVYLTPDKWEHVDLIYTVPATMDETQASKFGIFANPDGDNSMSFYLDDISVVPYNGNLSDGMVADSSLIEALDNFSFDASKGIKIELDKIVVTNSTGEYTDGKVVITATGDQNDPQARYENINIDAEKYGVIAIKFKYENIVGDTPFQIFFATADDEKLSEKKSTKINYNELEAIGDGYYVGYFEMGSNDAWSGTVTMIRIDPANSTGTYTIADAMFVKTK